MLDVIRGDFGGRFHLYSNHAVIGSFDNQVDLVFAIVGAQVMDARFGCLGLRQNRLRDERFE